MVALVRPRIKRIVREIYELRITLGGIDPPVWRLVHVPADATLHQLHDLIQAIMPWNGAHLYEFWARDQRIGLPDEEAEDNEDVLDSREVRLLDLGLRRRSWFIYVWDFGDDWRHTIQLVNRFPAESDATYPYCVDGGRAAPPDDCGGPSGYLHMLSALRDPAHAEHESWKTWVGDSFDPEAFDVDIANHDLRVLSRSWRGPQRKSPR